MKALVGICIGFGLGIVIVVLGICVGLVVYKAFQWAAVAGSTVSDGLVDELMDREGFRGLPYDDTRGDATLGYGTKLPITKAEGAWLLETRLADTHARLAKAWKPYGGLNKARQGVLLDMAYELGVVGVVGDPAITASGDCDKPRAGQAAWVRLPRHAGRP